MANVVGVTQLMAYGALTATGSVLTLKASANYLANQPRAEEANCCSKEWWIVHIENRSAYRQAMTVSLFAAMQTFFMTVIWIIACTFTLFQDQDFKDKVVETFGSFIGEIVSLGISAVGTFIRPAWAHTMTEYVGLATLGIAISSQNMARFAATRGFNFAKDFFTGIYTRYESDTTWGNIVEPISGLAEAFNVDFSGASESQVCDRLRQVATTYFSQ